jgi:hypothetical protein
MENIFENLCCDEIIRAGWNNPDIRGPFRKANGSWVLDVA